MSRFPFPTTPDSWYGVAWSHEVAVGQVVPIRYFGRDLVVFRGEDGRARVLDAICPHLGAHLGINGRVDGNTIVCPFHAWRFDGEGTCVEIPYAERVPKKARVDCWPTTEVNGAILVWHHHAKEPPSFEVPQLPQGDRGSWTAPLCRSVTVRTHVQEMNENIFDFAHFQYIHHFDEWREVDVEIDGPFAHTELEGHGSMYGRRWPMRTRASMYGAGFTVISVVKPAEFAVIVLKTPIDDETVEHRYGIVTPKRIPGIDRLVRRVIAHQVTADVVADSDIWNNKVHLSRPLVLGADGPIMKFRHWHKQFYPSRTPQPEAS